MPYVPTPGRRARRFARRLPRLPLGAAGPAGIAVGLVADGEGVSLRGIAHGRLLQANLLNLRHELTLAA